MMRAYKSSDQSGDGFIEEPEFAAFIHYLAFYDKLYDVSITIKLDF